MKKLFQISFLMVLVAFIGLLIYADLTKGEPLPVLYENEHGVTAEQVGIIVDVAKEHRVDLKDLYPENFDAEGTFVRQNSYPDVETVIIKVHFEYDDAGEIVGIVPYGIEVKDSNAFI